jgi:L-ascorbate metabolism protein UlaG (beta-lactamase superfamily)
MHPLRFLLFVMLGVPLFLLPQLLAAAPVEVLWLGHATTRITSVAGKVIVIDPFLRKNPKTPAKYRDLKALGNVDLILVTHGHSDHIADLTALVKLTDAKVVANYEYSKNLVSLGILKGDKTIQMNKGGYVEPIGRGIKIHMVPAEHSSSLDNFRLGVSNPKSKTARQSEGGVPVGYVVELENGFKIYHTGDTAIFGDMALIHALHKPDLALVCIGGRYTMGPEAAAYAVRELIKPKQVLPIHYGTFPPINRTPAEFRQAMGDTDVEILNAAPGQVLKY